MEDSPYLPKVVCRVLGLKDVHRNGNKNSRKRHNCVLLKKKTYSSSLDAKSVNITSCGSVKLVASSLKLVAKSSLMVEMSDLGVVRLNVQRFANV